MLGPEPPLVLLVEDDPDHAALTAHALGASAVDHTLVTFTNGLDALAYLTHRVDGRAALPRLLVLDLKLPGLDGLGVLEEVRANPATAHLPAVLMTSSDEDLDIERAYALGANSYVRKPVGFDDFRALIARLGRYWLEDNVVVRSP